MTGLWTPFRIEPRMGPGSYKTYGVRFPRETHTRAVKCSADNCDQFRQGWRTALDCSVPQQREAATWITQQPARHYTWEQVGSVVTFIFPPGQQCFRGHREIVRPGVFMVRDGDWRGNPTGRSAVLGEQQWHDDLGEHQQRLAEQQQRG